MGTNFYLNRIKHQHIGKRSAAGLYCWDCGLTLCVQGAKGVHTGRSSWHSCCPKCGKTQEDEGWEGAAGRELGFAEAKPRAKTGVKTCCSFTWAIDPKLIEGKTSTLANYKPVVDEYGDEYSWEEFSQVLAECPIRYFHLVGHEFS